MSERQRSSETNINQQSNIDDATKHLAEQAANIASLEEDPLFTGYEPKDNEVTSDDVRQFLDQPSSLAIEKIPSLVECYGHVSEVATRLISRDDCPPEAISSTCQLHGHNPAFADYIIKHKGQLADDDNRHLHETSRSDWALTVNQVYYQQLPEDINWQIYNDNHNDKYVLLAMLQQQSELPQDLVRQFFVDYSHDPEFAISLATAQQLPEDIIRQSFDQHKHWPGFVAALFQNQKDLPADLIDQAYHDYDRSFESILANSFAATDNLDDSIIYALERILPSGGMAIDLSNMRIIRVGQTGGRAEEIPGVVIDQALQEHRNFMGFVVGLLTQNQLEEEIIRSVYSDLGDKPTVAMTMIAFQKSIPLDIIRQACADHDQNIMFVEALFKNQKDLPFDIIEPIYQQHRWGQLFHGDWLAEQANLPAEKQQEASHWRHIPDLEAKPQDT